MMASARLSASAPLPGPLTAAEIIRRVVECGATFIVRDGAHVLRGAKALPPELLRAVRENAVEIKRLLMASPAARPAATQTALFGVQLVPSPATASSSFLDREEARFDALCAEYGVPVDPAKPAKRGAA